MADANRYSNGRCCVFQPFDGGEYDKRFDEVLAPAIEAALLEPYRVDRDAGSVIPVDTLHSEIKAATICLADITTRNPNVMYELGYALAAGRDVVLVCGPSTLKYPFDIQHRGIISYETTAPGDFNKLRDSITERLEALLKRQQQADSVIANAPVRSSDGLQSHEMTALALLLANCDSLEDPVSASWLKQEMSKAGYNTVGTRLALAKLAKLGYATSNTVATDYDQVSVFWQITSQGEGWLLDNQSRLQIYVPKAEPEAVTDEDIPF